MPKETYYQRNKERMRVKQREYYLANKERIAARSKAYYARNKDHSNKVGREWYSKNRDYKSEYNRELWKRLRMEVLEAAGGPICVQCGHDDWRALQVDHVNGGGRQEMQSNPTYNNPRVYATVIRANPSDYQVLCANCNWVKRYENKELRKKAIII